MNVFDLSLLHTMIFYRMHCSGGFGWLSNLCLIIKAELFVTDNKVD